jgi:hypothetical protein
MLEIDDNYQLAQEMYEQLIRTKETKERALEQACRDHLYDAYKTFREERLKPKVAQSSKPNPKNAPKKTTKKTPKKGSKQTKSSSSESLSSDADQEYQ